MEWLIVAGFVLWVFAKLGSKRNRTSPKAGRAVVKAAKGVMTDATKPKVSKAQKKLEQALAGWLRERWELAEDLSSKRGCSVIPGWFYDDITDHQKELLEEMDIQIDLNDLNKGQAADIIGLMEPCERENEEVLKFFGHKLAGTSQTEARHLVALYSTDKDAMARFENRPASPIDKTIFSFFGRKCSAGVTNKQCVQFEKALDQKAADDEDLMAKLDRWQVFREGFDELNDKDSLDLYFLKKVNAGLYLKAYRYLEQTGGVDESGIFDENRLVDCIVQLNPDIKKS